MANGPRKGAAGFAAGLAGSLQDLPQLLLMKQQLQQQEEERERRERQRQEEIDRNLALRRQDIGREDAFRRQDRADLSQERFGREQDKSNALFLEASALKQFAQPGDPPVERTA